MPTTHVVKPGESLTSIARKYGLSDWHAIYNSLANKKFKQKHPNPDLIFPGDQLEIPDKPGTTVGTAVAPEFSFTILDSLSGKPFDSMTLKLRLPDGNEEDFVTDKSGSVTVTHLENRAVTENDRFDLIDLFDGSAVPPIDYSGFARFGLQANTSYVIHIPDKRAVADGIVKKLSITRRTAWGKKTPNYASMESDWDYTIVTLHHSGPSGETKPEEIEEKHMVTEHQWQDVGYHYIIEPDGKIAEGRHIAFKGSHVDLANTGKIGVLIAGDFVPSHFNPHSGKPTADQMKAAEDLINALKSAFPTITKIGGHKDYKTKTECPGDELYKLIPGLRTKTSLGGP